MRLHFFSVNDIQEYRKNYKTEPMVKKAFEQSHPRTIEELDQAVFFLLAKVMYNLPNEVLESEIYGETDIPGLRPDFNFGLRLDVPEGNFCVRVSDFDTGDVFFDKYISGGRLISVERYFFLCAQKIFYLKRFCREE